MLQTSKFQESEQRQSHLFSSRPLTPGKFYKGGSQEKYPSRGRVFPCFPAHVIEQDLFLPSVPCARFATHSCVALLGSYPSGFHRLFATRPVRSETNKQFTGQLLTMVLFGTRGP